MRIVFIGNVDFSYHGLKEVLSNNGQVIGIVTCTNSKVNSDFVDLTPLAKQNNIPIYYYIDINDKLSIEWIKEKNPDIIFCWGISQLIKTELLKLAPMGVVGVHPALLPQNRGRHPIIWALVLGLRESGLTFFFMDEGADSGDILSQEKFTITEKDTATILYKKIKELASKQIREFLPKLINNEYKRIRQVHNKANYWRKRTRKDGIIDWRMSKNSILNLIRALTKPYPGAETLYKGYKIVIWSAEIYTVNIPNIEPGKIINVIDGKPVIKCEDGAIMLKEYDSEIEFIEGDYVI